VSVAEPEGLAMVQVLLLVAVAVFFVVRLAFALARRPR
jgi:hypothetical protein